MNITKEQADKVIDALSMNRIMARDENGNYTKEITAQVVAEALSIMRGLAEDAEPEVWRMRDTGYRSPVYRYFDTKEDAESNAKMMLQSRDDGHLTELTPLYTSPQAAQTALKSESSAQAAQALARLPSEGKPIEALAPTEAALREVVRLSEDAGLYDDFQTEAQERPAYTEGDVVGLCVCGSWSGGRCLRCEWRAGSKP